MKRVLVVLLLLLPLGFGTAYAQTLKFAHIDRQALIKLMPEMDSATRKLQAFEKNTMDQMDQLQVEMNTKYQDYLQKKEKLSPALLQAKEKELQELQQRLQEYNYAAQKDYQDLSGKLMNPIMDRCNQAIQKVGKANGYTYVFDSSMQLLIYISDQSTDLMPLVKKELGITK